MNHDYYIEIGDSLTTAYGSRAVLGKMKPVEFTDWQNANKKEPGQPGVFEVNPVTLDDSGEERRRFSYFDGKKFGPLSTSVEGAHRERFNHSTLSSTITKWRGYAEEV